RQRALSPGELRTRGDTSGAEDDGQGARPLGSTAQLLSPEGCVFAARRRSTPAALGNVRRYPPARSGGAGADRPHPQSGRAGGLCRLSGETSAYGTGRNTLTDRKRLLEKCHATFRFAEKQLKHLIETHPDYFPLYTVNGKWKHGGEAWTNWCEGFLGGQLWLIYGQNGDSYFREKAEHYSRLIEHRKTDTKVHDLGFLFWSTWKRWYDLTGDPDLNRVVIEAGQTAGSRFRQKGQYLPSFVAPESLFIDIMMNVGIIYYAGQQTGDPELMCIANQHCLTTRRYLVRGDGSTSHEGIFNTET